MDKLNKRKGKLCIGLGIIFCLYYVSLLSFALKISFSQFWIAIGIILIIYGIFKYKNLEVFSNLKGVRKILKVIISLLILLFILIEIPILYCGNKSYKGKTDYIIVLGAGLNGNTMSLTLYQRVEKALEYVKNNPETKLILSGGKGSYEHISEAEAMEKYFLNKGIDKNRIIKEDKSTNTYENLVFSYKKLKNVENKTQEDIKNLKIGVVTSNFHVFRAKLLGKRVGMNLEGIPSKVMPLLQPNFYVREALAVVKSILFDK